jgi:2-dehydro-3-deoxyphosphogluconate aldolase/(4S)-4-hydroxy-2-oxoglutarate aldolase
MARFARLTVLNTMIDIGLVPLFHNPDIEVSKKIVGALARGGARVVEFTNRGDQAIEVFSELERFCAAEHQDVILGAGSIIDIPTAAAYINAGAGFVVSPTLDRGVAELCNRRKIAHVPGCATATEIVNAHELGCEIVKVFPGGLVGGPAFVKAVKGPIPSASLMPTGGVDITEDSLAGWFDAGVPCVGMGSKLVTKDLVEAGDWEGLERRVTDVIQLISDLRH